MTIIGAASAKFQSLAGGNSGGTGWSVNTSSAIPQIGSMIERTSSSRFMLLSVSPIKGRNVGRALPKITNPTSAA